MDVAMRNQSALGEVIADSLKNVQSWTGEFQKTAGAKPLCRNCSTRSRRPCGRRIQRRTHHTARARAAKGDQHAV
ncbi:hypothetical protein CA601_02595 [Paraburkholderia hospita]|nr:hypothetical protein CA601_02595 [Paraburkholderia hospita]